VELKDVMDQVDQVSAQYCRKFGIERNNEWFLLKIQEELGELVQCYLEMSHKARSRDNTYEELKGNFDNEIVDLLCLVLSMSKVNEVDLEKVIREKWLKWLER
jgi:NTP pyrophosphatase (non-canonical NTP hydrolase)